MASLEINDFKTSTIGKIQMAFRITYNANINFLSHFHRRCLSGLLILRFSFPYPINRLCFCLNMDLFRKYPFPFMTNLFKLLLSIQNAAILQGGINMSYLVNMEMIHKERLEK
jgi:hypothetical protein